MADFHATRPMSGILGSAILIALSSAGVAAGDVNCKEHQNPSGGCLTGNSLYCSPPVNGKCYTTHIGDKFDCECQPRRQGDEIRPETPVNPTPRPVPTRPPEYPPR